MNRAKFIVALWFMLNGVFPAVPYNIHKDREGETMSEAIDITVHMLGLLAVCVMLYDRYVERRG